MPPYLREYSSSRLKHIPSELTRVCMHVHRISGAAVQLCRASDAPASRRRRPRVHARTYRSMFFLSLSLSLCLSVSRLSVSLTFSFGERPRKQGHANGCELKNGTTAASGGYYSPRRWVLRAVVEPDPLSLPPPPLSLYFIPPSIFHSTTLISILLPAQFKSPPARWHSSGNVRPLLPLFFLSFRFLPPCFLPFSTFASVSA